MEIGSDVNYGAITTQLVDNLNKHQNFKLSTSTEVTGISQNDDKTWTVSFKNMKTGQADHVKHVLSLSVRVVQALNCCK